MNIVKIKVKEPEYDSIGEFIFKTKLPESFFYDCDHHLTEKFKHWLANNNYYILERVESGLFEDIFWYSDESIDEIFI